LEYLLAATILAGILQLFWSAIKLANCLKYVSHAVMVGFVNALAILIFMAQLPELFGNSWQVYVMVAGALGIIYLLPRLTTAVPSPLVDIIVIMAGCAMIGQSVINIKSGGRTRLSTLSAGVFLLFFMLVVGKWVERIPMAALVAVMIMVSIGTFNWSSFKQIQRIPRSETAIMVTTVLLTVLTHNLAIGVLSGVSLNGILFCRKIAQLVFVDTVIDPERELRVYSVAGQIFFVSVNDFLAAFNFKEDLEMVKIDLTHAHLWDRSAIAALDKVVLNFRRNGVEVDLVGLNKASATLVDRLAIHDKPEAFPDLTGH
jgi:SulP family sulfate permease